MITKAMIDKAHDIAKRSCIENTPCEACYDAAIMAILFQEYKNAPSADSSGGKPEIMREIERIAERLIGNTPEIHPLDLSRESKPDHSNKSLKDINKEAAAVAGKLHPVFQAIIDSTKTIYGMDLTREALVEATRVGMGSKT